MSSIVLSIFGFLKNPKVVLAIVLLGLLSYLAKSGIDSVKETAYLKGVLATDLKWNELMLKQKKAYDLEIVRLNDLARETEAELNSKLVRLESDVKKQFQGALNEKDNLIDKLRSGNLRLSIDLRRTASNAATSDLAAATALRNATYRAELSEEASEFLITYAADADRAAIALGACQETIVSYINAVQDHNQKYKK